VESIPLPPPPTPTLTIERESVTVLSEIPRLEPKVPVSKYTLRVFYATNRGGHDGEYTSEDTQNLTLGIAYVSIPPNHKSGAIETGSWVDIVLRRTPSNDFKLVRARELDRTTYFAKMRDVVGSSQPRQLFVYVHGFANSFRDAVFRGAQLAFDLNFEGAAVIFSWPSAGDLRQYARDRRVAAKSARQLRRFLDLLADRSDAEVIHLIVHSMGNYVLQQALTDADGRPLPLSWSDAKLHQVVLAAADLNPKGMQDLTRALKRRTPAIPDPAVADPIQNASRLPHLTLYASNKDNALLASFAIHWWLPVGRIGENPLAYPATDTVDLTGVTDDFLGHSDFAESEHALSDLKLLINDEWTPKARGLIPAPPLWRP